MPSRRSKRRRRNRPRKRSECTQRVERAAAEFCSMCAFLATRTIAGLPCCGSQLCERRILEDTTDG